MSETLPQPERDWSELFPDQDYRFSMGLKQGDPAKFFSPSHEYQAAIAERRQWLASGAERYAALFTDGIPLLAETRSLAQKWHTLPEFLPPQDDDPAAAWDNLMALGRNWETDFLLLKIEGYQVPKLVGGCVCFPSSWNLEEKMGRRIDFIHEAVPGLNASMGRSIGTFLNKLRPDVAWLRANWGLAATGERNLHPARGMARLRGPLTLDEVWLRIEDQALVALPGNDGVLFGIRLTTHPLRSVVQNPIAKQGLSRALRTMPLEMIEYKGLSAARESLITMVA
ncbi:MAG TPA: heme-dependent oxidative N-demethylase subunit alpha family protein [Verrucomicrobiae bacterium]